MLTRLDHTGFAVRDLQTAVTLFRETFGARIGPVFVDPIQRVSLCFAEFDGGRVELIAPLGADSPVTNIVAKGGGCYHLCYASDDLDAEIERLREGGFTVLATPQPAIAFAGRRVAFLFHRVARIIEILEK